MMQRVVIAILVFSLTPLLATLAGDLKILTPAGFVSTHGSRLTVVGTTSAPLVEVFINDGKFGDFSVQNGIFHVPLSFGYGLNEVQVTAVYSGAIETTDNSVSLEILCGPASVGKLHRIYPEHLFHEQEIEFDCRRCHNDTKGGQTQSAGGSYCASCHGRLSHEAGMASKMADKDCALCHTEDGDSRSERIISRPASQKCFSCHQDKIKSFNQEYVHGPVAGGSCTVCHDPHGSKFEHSLKNAVEILCFTCHKFTKVFKDLPVQHPPFANGKCVACHDPHSTANRWVLVKSSETVCLECHDPEGDGMDFHSHPYNVKPKKPLTSKLELSPKGRLECISCHNPHATDSEHLLRITQKFTCIGCHAEKH